MEIKMENIEVRNMSDYVCLKSQLWLGSLIKSDEYE